ncbi:hypothetical protein FKZ68_01785 [Bacteroides xylanisolvens]|nr:hypothetical protein FKZ68_01785 [Bacteroides xylanisolvens]
MSLCTTDAHKRSYCYCKEINPVSHDIIGWCFLAFRLSPKKRLSCNSWGIKFSQFPSCIYLC